MEPTTQTLSETTIAVWVEGDVNALKRLVSGQAAAVDMGLLNKTKLVTAASELVRNMLKYAGGGQVVVATISHYNKTGIRITFTDQGPGISDVSQVMKDGYSTGNTLGLGLPGARRLMDEFSIVSGVSKGTTVIITKWANG